MKPLTVSWEEQWEETELRDSTATSSHTIDSACMYVRACVCMWVYVRTCVCVCLYVCMCILKQLTFLLLTKKEG